MHRAHADAHSNIIKTNSFSYAYTGFEENRNRWTPVDGVSHTVRLLQYLKINRSLFSSPKHRLWVLAALCSQTNDLTAFSAHIFLLLSLKWSEYSLATINISPKCVLISESSACSIHDKVKVGCGCDCESSHWHINSADIVTN